MPVTVGSSRKRKSELREFGETLIGALILAILIMIFVARAFTVEGPSMLPTLHNGEKVLVDKLTYRFREPRRGEIVVFKFPLDPSQYYIKRIIGVPGDVVAIEGGRVILNGEVLREEYLLEPTRYSYGPYKVPSGKYFVLGDNRNNSEDSRSRRVGFIPRDLIVGRAIWRYWPPGRMDILQLPPVFRQVNQAARAAN